MNKCIVKDWEYNKQIVYYRLFQLKIYILSLSIYRNIWFQLILHLFSIKFQQGGLCFTIIFYIAFLLAVSSGNSFLLVDISDLIYNRPHFFVQLNNCEEMHIFNENIYFNVLSCSCFL